MSMSRSSRMLHYINYRMKITLQDSRIIVGTFMAFDKHMNMVLGDAEEFRKIKSKKGSGLTEEKLEKRTLGLIVLRGDSVVSLTIEGPPPPEQDDKATPGGPGSGKAVGRGLPMAPVGGAPVGLAGPVRGVGGPMSNLMQPAGHVAAQAFPRPMGMPMPPGLPVPPGMPPGMPPMGLPRPPVPGMPGAPPGMPVMGVPPAGFPPRPMPGFPPHN